MVGVGGGGEEEGGGRGTGGPDLKYAEYGSRLSKHFITCHFVVFLAQGFFFLLPSRQGPTSCDAQVADRLAPFFGVSS